jgi:hypothetical protein
MIMRPMKLFTRNAFENIRACSVSQKVLKTISNGFQGKIAAIFNRSFNIETRDRFIINIGTNNLPLTPRSTLVSVKDFYHLIFPKISLGSFILGYNACIYIPDIQLYISLKTASQFNPKLELSGNLLPDHKIKNNLIVAVKWVTMGNHRPNEVSFSPLSGYFLSRCPFISNLNLKRLEKTKFFSSNGCGLSLNFKKNLWERIDYFLFAMGQYSWSDILKAVQSIIGFGPGLTPSGDDFLAGFISTGIIFGSICPHINEFAKNIGTMVNNQSIGKTTNISLSMLEDASNGEIAEPALNLVRSTLLTENVDQIKYFAEQVSSIGGSSGEDLFNGVATGIWFFKRVFSKLHANN